MTPTGPNIPEGDNLSEYMIENLMNLDYVYDDCGRILVADIDGFWQPHLDENLGQTFQCVEKLGLPFTLECIGDYRATFEGGSAENVTLHQGTNKSPALAILQAIYQAMQGDQS